MDWNAMQYAGQGSNAPDSLDVPLRMFTQKTATLRRHDFVTKMNVFGTKVVIFPTKMQLPRMSPLSLHCVCCLPRKVESAAWLRVQAH